MSDNHKNFAYSFVVTAPSPADSGTSLIVTSGEGVLFPIVPFNVTIWQTGVQPSSINAEIVRVTNISTDTFTIVRQQEGTTARNIVIGDQIAATITNKTLTDIETVIPTTFDDLSDGTTNKAYTATEQSKLSGIAGGAEVNVNADWNAGSGDAQILNKPSIPTALADLSDDATHRLTTDTEKGTWNGKQNSISNIGDYPYIRQSEIDRQCSGLGGNAKASTLISGEGGSTFNVASGFGYINDHSGTAGTFKRIDFATQNGLAIAGNGVNYIAIDSDGIASASLTKQTMSDHISLGHLYVAAGTIIEIFNVPEWAGHFEGRLNEFIADGIKTIVADGLVVSEQATPLKLSVSAGEMLSRLSEFQFDSPITTFVKIYNNNGTWTQDTNNPNYVNVTQWNDVTSGLITMTGSGEDNYWKKDLVLLTPDGYVYFVFGQAEYATEDAAKLGSLPVIPEAIRLDSAYLAAIVCQKGDTTIGNGLLNITPNFDRIFGYGTQGDGTVIDHGTLTGLGDDDHTQYLNSSRFGNKSVSDLIDVAVTTPIVDQIIRWDGYNWVNSNIGQSGGAGIVYYLNAVDSDVSGYDTFTTIPSESAETYESTNVAVSDGDKLIKAYVSGALGRTIIDAGIWGCMSYTSTDAAGGAAMTMIKMKIYKRLTDSPYTETLLFECDCGEINSLTVSMIQCEQVQPDFLINSTDRLVIKYYASTDNATNVNVKLYLQGNLNYSHVHTPLAIVHNDLAGLNVGDYKHITAAQLTVVGNTSGTNSGDGAGAGTAQWNADKIQGKTFPSLGVGDDEKFPKYDNDTGAFIMTVVSPGSGDVIAPASNTDNYLSQWNGTDSKTLKDGLAVPAGGLAGLTALGNKQDTLISGTNIKTINSNSLLGSGDLIVGGASEAFAVAMAVAL